MSKFSVRKPFTVLVGIIMILVLGVVSVTRMTTDLLPEMSLPYAIVITTYAGASPEEVETSVTRPIESSMATVSNIENVSSVSSENYSMVVLEFAQDTDMDSVSLEMRENLDQLDSVFPDAAGSPLIMQIDPDMMPVVISAVSMEGADRKELSSYVNDELSAEIESIEGVASVTVTGATEDSVQVIVDKKKVDAVNAKVFGALDQQFADAYQELDDAKQELADSKAQAEDGQEQLEAGKETALEQLAQGQLQIAVGQQELLTNRQDVVNAIAAMPEQEEAAVAEIEKQRSAALAELDEKAAPLLEQEQQLLLSEQELSAQETTLKEQKEELVAKQQELSAQETALAAQKAEWESSKTLLQTQLLPMVQAVEQNEALSPEEKAAALANILAQMPSELQSQFPDGVSSDAITQLITKTDETIAQSEAAISEGKTQITDGISQIDAGLSQVTSGKEQLAEGKAQLEAAKAQLEAARAQINAGFDNGLAEAESQIAEAEAQLEAALTQIDAGQVSLNEALAELNKQSNEAVIEISTNSVQLTSALSQIEEGEQQLEDGLSQLDDTKEAAYEQADMTNVLTVSMIEQILTAQNFSMPAGYITEDSISYLVRVGEKKETIDDLKNMVLMDVHMDGVDPVRLSDVADVLFGEDAAGVYAKVNGAEGIMLSVEKQTGYSTGEVSDSVLDRFDELEKTEDGLQFTTLMDQGVYIEMVVNTVVENIVLGAIMAVLILLLFLRDLRPTLVVAISIPLSVLTAIVLMYFSGVTLNIISLSGLAVGIGMLVDNSIVVIENIYRLRRQGHPAREAAVAGAKQMSGAITASTLTTVCVYLPIIFMEGITRQLFVDMGLTIAYSLLASLVIALTLVPAASAGLLKNVKTKKKQGSGKFLNAYEKLLRGALKWKPVVLLVTIALLVGSVFLAISRGSSFMPQMESTQMSISMEAPEGSTLEETSALADQVVEEVLQADDVVTVGAMSATSGSSMLSMGNTSDTSVTMYVILDEDKKHTGDEIAAQIQERTKDLDCTLDISTSLMDLSALGGSGIQVEIKGKELDTLESLATQTAEILQQTEGLQNVSDGMEETTPEIDLAVDEEKAAACNLTTAQIYQFIYAKVADATAASTLSDESKDYDIYVSDGSDTELTRKDLEDLEISYTDSDGETQKVKLSELVTFTEGEGLSSISRDAQQRTLTVSGELESGYNVGLVSDDVTEALEALDLPEGYSVEMQGEDATINEAMSQVMLMLVLALIFMYLIMVAQFQSLLSPFIVMFTIPVAFTGGFLALFLTGNEVSVIGMLGMVMLSGIIVNNGIVLVDYANQLRAQGMSKKDALVEAGRTRMRPVMMTALTTILGLLPMLLSTEMGADMMKPLVIVMIGGLLYGTLLTLFIVPCIYDLLRREKNMVEEEIKEIEDQDAAH